MEHRELKDALYEQFGRIGKGISSPRRIEILDLLSQGERTVEQIAEETALTVKNTSSHLRTLHRARLVETRKEPPYVHYRLADESVFRLVRGLQDVARTRLAEVERMVRLYFDDRDKLEPLSAAELEERMEEGDVVVLDVRPPEEYRAGHIPGARSVPVEELERRLRELPRDREVIAYCRGPFCAFSLEALEILRSHGLEARRLEDGLPDWRSGGRPVQVGSAS